MNLYGTVILAALLIEFLLDRFSDRLDLKSLRPDPPEEFRSLVDSERYRKILGYTTVRTRFGSATATFDLAILLMFWFSGGFNYADRIVRSWGLPDVPAGLTYIGILMCARFLLSLPFSAYDTFVIESRFGFNRTTPATFAADRIKGLLLSIALGGPLLAAILALFQAAGTAAWALVWLVVTVFSMAVQFVAPAWILPLFNRFTPLEDGPLRDSILRYAASVRFPLKDVLIMDGSRRSEKSNAFFTGFGRNKRIALFDTLIRRHSVPEMTAVLAHEIGHYKLKHVPQGIAIGILHSGILLFLMSLFIRSRGLFEAFGMDHPSVYAGLLFFGLLYAPVEFGLAILLNALSRHNEKRADRFAARTTGDPASLAAALKKMSAHNLANLTPHPLSVFLHHSHPPVLKRIHGLENGGSE
jgi:STE24 endopeptidase